MLNTVKTAESKRNKIEEGRHQCQNLFAKYSIFFYICVNPLKERMEKISMLNN